MPNLELLSAFRLFGVAQKPGRNGLFRLEKFKNDVFNHPIDSSEVEGTLTDLTKALYNFEEGCCWYEMTGDKCEGETFRIKIEQNEWLVIFQFWDLKTLAFRRYFCFTQPCPLSDDS